MDRSGGPLRNGQVSSPPPAPGSLTPPPTQGTAPHTSLGGHQSAPAQSSDLQARVYSSLSELCKQLNGRNPILNPFALHPTKGGGIDLQASMLKSEMYDWFDLDDQGAIVIQPRIPIFPEDFPPGQKEWPLSWWGIVDPAIGGESDEGTGSGEAQTKGRSKSKSKDRKRSQSPDGDRSHKRSRKHKGDDRHRRSRDRRNGYDGYMTNNPPLPPPGDMPRRGPDDWDYREEPRRPPRFDHDYPHSYGPPRDDFRGPPPPSGRYDDRYPPDDRGPYGPPLPRGPEERWYPDNRGLPGPGEDRRRGGSVDRGPPRRYPLEGGRYYDDRERPPDDRRRREDRSSRGGDRHHRRDRD